MKCCNIYHWDLNISLSESNVACSPVKVWSFEDDEDMEPTGLSSFSKFISDTIMQECEQEFQRRNEILDLCADIEEALAVVQSF
ncbi:hypothetical protein TNIN_211891 [Trichonephila inaurata madagascariensis]|uniref:Uncharacterized protein n=1 Tax=Trichonephila inaurata madagascariensis TaxID=2747483 RepID=A0A8X7BX73_9ARAC|nr:hypothetical protein TNIN_211891 [Trichonephila inaurata madagascariensis]